MRDCFGNICYTNENGKWFFEKEELPLYGTIWLSNDSDTVLRIYCARNDMLNESSSAIFLGFIGGYGFHIFDGFCSHRLVKERLDLDDVDIRPIADFINAQTLTKEELLKTEPQGLLFPTCDI